MKTLKLIIVTGIVLFFASTAMAQVSVNVNIGSPPMWGPVGYTDVQYYYLPDVEAYYDVPSSMFIYYNRGAWIHRTYLPARYRNYDLYRGYKVVMTDYRGNAPYTHFKEYKMKYAKGYRGHEQRNIGERPEKENRGSKYSHEGKHGHQESGRGNYGDGRGRDNGNHNGNKHDKGNNGDGEKHGKKDK